MLLNTELAVPYFRHLVAGFPPRRLGFEPGSGHVGFVVDKVPLGQVFSKYLGFHCQFAFHWLLHTHHLSSRAGTIGQTVATVPSGLSHPMTKIKYILNMNKIRLAVQTLARRTWVHISTLAYRQTAYQKPISINPMKTYKSVKKLEIFLTITIWPRINYVRGGIGKFPD
jgi:hypothetical protein